MERTGDGCNEVTNLHCITMIVFRAHWRLVQKFFVFKEESLGRAKQVIIIRFGEGSRKNWKPAKNNVADVLTKPELSSFTPFWRLMANFIRYVEDLGCENESKKLKLLECWKLHELLRCGKIAYTQNVTQGSIKKNEFTVLRISIYCKMC